MDCKYIIYSCFLILDLDLLNYFLWIEIITYNKNWFCNQWNNILNLLGMHSKSTFTPLDTKLKLEKTNVHHKQLSTIDE